MIFQKRFQELLDRIKEHIPVRIDIVDDEGNVIVSTHEDATNEKIKVIQKIDFKKNNIQEYKTRTYVEIIWDRPKPIYLIGYAPIKELGKEFLLLKDMVEVFARIPYQRLDRIDIMRCLLQGKYSEVEMDGLALDERINPPCKCCVFVLKIHTGSAYRVVQTLNTVFAETKDDLVFQLNKGTVILLKTQNGDDEENYLEDLAGAMLDTIQNELGQSATIGIGFWQENVNGILLSYGQAAQSIAIGQLMHEEGNVFSHRKLRLEKYIMQVPMDICRAFYQEFMQNPISQVLGEEMMHTVRVFFESSLNMSETARRLLIHRNTLVYRLDRIHKQLGLDLRNFKDAVSLKVLMIIGNSF